MIRKETLENLTVTCLVACLVGERLKEFVQEVEQGVELQDSCANDSHGRLIYECAVYNNHGKFIGG